MFATQIVDHGFSRGLLDLVVILLPIGPLKQAYRPLTDAWKTVLRERRGPREPHVKPARQFASALDDGRRGDFVQTAWRQLSGSAPRLRRESSPAARDTSAGSRSREPANPRRDAAPDFASSPAHRSD